MTTHARVTMLRSSVPLARWRRKSISRQAPPLLHAWQTRLGSPIIHPRTCRNFHLSAPASQAVQRPRVLLVDDEPAIVAVLSRILSRAGYDVDTAADGSSALAQFG